MARGARINTLGGSWETLPNPPGPVHQWSGGLRSDAPHPGPTRVSSSYATPLNTNAFIAATSWNVTAMERQGAICSLMATRPPSVRKPLGKSCSTSWERGPRYDGHTAELTRKYLSIAHAIRQVSDDARGASTTTRCPSANFHPHAVRGLN